MSYLFRDTDLAARRLQRLAEVFYPSSHAFLQGAVTTPPRLALDLGCGPGYTTHLLAEATHARQVIGLDSSAHFIELARQNAIDGISFLHHDVTRTPFPVGPCNLLSCRMLLTHLRDPQAVIERWATRLQPEGLLLLEEVEWIKIGHPLFRSYLEIVDSMLAQQGQQLYIGSLLDQQQTSRNLKRCFIRIYHLPVATKQAADLFVMNIQSWKSQPFIQQSYPAALIAQLEQNLQELAETATGEGEIEWGMRQIAYERA